MEIGIDIEENSRFLNISENMKKRIYTQKEINYALSHKNYQNHFCAMWCVKEATVKAFSNLTIPFLQIETTYSKTGKPDIVLNETIKNELKKLGYSSIKISMSHSKNYSTAVCIIC